MAVQRIRAGEYYALILFGALGMCLMSSAVELVLIFIALEISSISTYILAGFRRRVRHQQRIFAQIFPAGIICHRILPLRRRADVWRHRIDEHRRSLLKRCESDQIPLLAYAAACPDVRGTRFQGGGRSLSCVDARRVRRRSGAEWSASCPPRPRPRHLPCCCGLCLKSMRPGRLWSDLGVGGAVHDPGQCRRAGAAER